MSRAPHDDITRALPGEDNAETRRRLRRAIRKVQDLLPDGHDVLIYDCGKPGFELIGERTEPPRSLLDALRSLVNRYSLENGSDTPDYILARYLLDSLDAYNRAVRDRDRHEGRAEGRWWANTEESP